MIKYNLKCKNKHEFESWFLDSKEFEKLKLKKMIECSFCGTKSIDKTIMSPNIGIKELEEKGFKTSNKLEKVRSDLLKMRNFIEKNFPREVRNIYYDKRKNKNIYGKATQEESEQLKDEGIELTAVPWIDKTEDN